MVMARHPDITEQAIIQAGNELEKTGKTPNPGAIRAHLGYRGGLLRIKSVWQQYLQQREGQLKSKPPQEMSFEALPDTYAENASQLISRVTNAIEQLTIEAYLQSQKLFEKRLKILEKSHQETITHYQQAELSADQSILHLENEMDELQTELQKLADQNAQLLIENAEYRGRLAAIVESQTSIPTATPNA
jgi:chromosome segregation ATPase